MLVEVLLFYEDGAGVAHVSGGTAGELVVVAVQFDGVALGRDWPAAERELFWVVGLPDLHFVDLVVGQAGVLHQLSETVPEIVGVVLAHQ